MNESTTAIIDTFFSEYRTRKYSKGQILILANEDTGYIYQVLSGRVKQYDVSYQGDEIILHVFKSPALFPLSVAINHTHDPFTYEAETNIEIRQAPAKDFIQFIRSKPEVLYDFLGCVYRDLDTQLIRTVHLMCGSAKVRLMYEMLIACRRFGTKQNDGSYLLVMYESDLGARAGLSRETVSREMRKLEKEGFVAMKPGNIRIHNLLDFEKKLSSII